MRDTFFTIMVVWLVWKIYNSFRSHSYSGNTQHNFDTGRNKQEEIHIEDLSKKNSKKKNKNDGEYIDYEEIK